MHSRERHARRGAQRHRRHSNRAAARAARIAAVAVWALVAPRLGAQSAPAYWGDLRPGSHAVGYRLEYVRDPSRTAALPPRADSLPIPGPRRGAEPERILPLRIWYPAVRVAGHAPMRYGDYLATRPESGAAPAIADSLRERTVGLVRFAARWYAAPTGAGRAPVSAGDTAGLADRLLAMPAHARRGARPAPGSFPVVIFAGGASHSEDENVVLWEYLASHGYVVAAFPSVGVGQTSLPASAPGLEVQARDVEAVIGHLKSARYADRRRLAAMGFSVGGAAALMAAARNSWIDAVVGLDPSFIARHFAPMVRASPLFSPARVGVPVLEFHRADTTVTFALVDSLGSMVRHDVEFVGLDHIDFGSYASAYRAALRGQRVALSAMRDSALAAKAAAYVGMAVVTREFLDAYLKGVQGAEARLHESLRPDARLWSGLPTRAVRVRSRARENQR